jgi:hypothetical protein
VHATHILHLLDQLAVRPLAVTGTPTLPYGDGAVAVNTKYRLWTAVATDISNTPNSIRMWPALWQRFLKEKSPHSSTQQEHNQEPTSSFMLPVPTPLQEKTSRVVEGQAEDVEDVIQ